MVGTVVVSVMFSFNIVNTVVSPDCTSSVSTEIVVSHETVEPFEKGEDLV